MILLPVINAILFALCIIVLLPIMVFCAECLAALFTRQRFWADNKERWGGSCTAAPGSDSATSAPAGRPRAAVLIPAHNEQLVIEQTLESLQPHSIGFANNRVLVVADNCDDQTAARSQSAGAEVIVRIDPEHRGKGFAMQSGLQALRQNPPEVVIVIDADCLADPQSIDTLAELAWRTQRPVQALNLTDRNAPADPFEAVSLLGNRFMNLIRPLGLARLGVPCRLMGTGMAIPWPLADKAKLAGASLVEDMQLGIDLALQGHLTLFCPDARVTSALPPADRAFVSQRTRWDHGHLRTAAVQIPRLLAAAVRRRSWPLLGLALDLSVPPLTLLVALWLGAAILAGIGWWLGASWLPLAMLAGGGIALAAALGLGWAVFCRRQVPLRAFAAAPHYMLRKLPIYAGLLFRRQHAWVRTQRQPTNRR